MADFVRRDHNSSGLLCGATQIAFSNQNTTRNKIRDAIASPSWGRIFYLNEEFDLREEGSFSLCDWGIFIASSGLGLWKWAGRDGVNWYRAELGGVFCWHDNPAEARRFLARHTSMEVWEYLKEQLRNEESEMTFARHWLQIQNDGLRIDATTVWERGSREECEKIVHWLLLSYMDCDGGQQSLGVVWEREDGSLNPLTFTYYFGQVAPSIQLDKLTQLLLKWFVVRPKFKKDPLCVETSDYYLEFLVNIENPSAHERLEAQLQFQQWCSERGLTL